MIERSVRVSVAMKLSLIRREVASLRTELASLDLTPRESARFAAALARIERRATDILVAVVATAAGH